MSDPGSVRVAVRIRPYNQREKDLNAKQCLRMEGPTTYITEPDTGVEKPFTFDYSYWSHDQFHEEDGVLVGDSDKYATQRMVFDDLGNDIQQSAFDGYNSCLFAYGQTGSGKSYSMMGYGKNKGIIPIVCEEMFHRVEKNTDPHVKYEIVVSMLEIYNECVKDLLNPKNNPPGGLKIRYKDAIGVYVEDLKECAVRNYAEVEAKMDEGTTNRSVASTKMNATSSRAHTVFSIVQVKRRNEMGQQSEIRSRINLVDLAGSERADSTGATGDRLKEGCAINQSLSALGNVISALADKANGKKKVFIPYRNSALTRLLQDALGGNSRTIMICALSPADVNFDETVSTLRYASRAKQIKNVVVKNENPTDKLIQQLKEENARLQSMLEGKIPLSGEGGDVTELRAELERIQREKEENDKMLKQLQVTWEEKLLEAQKSNQDDSQATSSSAIGKIQHPYLINLHEDPMLNECVVYDLKRDEIRVGKGGSDVTAQDIVITGQNVKNEHALLCKQGNTFTISAISEKTKLFVNGVMVTASVTQQHHDRIIIGNNYVFRFNLVHVDHVDDVWCGEHAYEEAIKEYQSKQGLRVHSDVSAMEQEEASKTKDMERQLEEMQRKLDEEKKRQIKQLRDQEVIMQSSTLNDDERRAKLLQIQQAHAVAVSEQEECSERDRQIAVKVMQEQVKKQRQQKRLQGLMGNAEPLVTEANAICEELGRAVRFEAKLVAQVRANADGFYQNDAMQTAMNSIVPVVLVRMDGAVVGRWSMEKFETRLFLMRELVLFINEHGPVMLPKSKDPFWDPPESTVVGKARIVTKALTQLVEIDGKTAFVNDENKAVGSVQYECMPVTAKGEPEEYKDSREDALGSVLRFRWKQQGLTSHGQGRVRVRVNMFGQQLASAYLDSHMAPTLDFEQTLFCGVLDENKCQTLQRGAVELKMDYFDAVQTKEQDANKFWLKVQEDGLVSVAAEKAPMVTLRIGKNTKQPILYPPATMVNEISNTGTLFMTEPQEEKSDSMENSNNNTITCMKCQIETGTTNCIECNTIYCTRCAALMHKAPSRKAHQLLPLPSQPVYTSTPVRASQVSPMSQPEYHTSTNTNVCNKCNSEPQALQCVSCSMSYCTHCDMMMHKAASRRDHVRTSIVQATPVPESIAPANVSTNCTRCEHPATVYCGECSASYCSHCDTMMHKAPSRKAHVRSSL